MISLKSLQKQKVFNCASLCSGPQDHGWCSGYTCQKRVSLFHSLVATGHSFDVFFSSVSPQKLRLMMLNSDPSEVSAVSADLKECFKVFQFEFFTRGFFFSLFPPFCLVCAEHHGVSLLLQAAAVGRVH